jgi:hypothetical protein
MYNHRKENHMGVVWSIVRDDVKEAFNLDKGNWFGLFRGPDEKDSFVLSPEHLAERIHSEVYPHLNMQYAEMLAGRIIRWCGVSQIRIISDVGWDQGLEYKRTADRFSPSYIDGYEDYKKRLE